MKDFVRNILAVLAGLVLFAFVLIGFVIVLVAGVMSDGTVAEPVRPGAVLYIRLDGILVEDTEQDSFSELLGDNFTTVGLKPMLEAIKTAKQSSDIAGIYLEAGNFEVASPAMTEELRDALADFKSGGKFIVSYGDRYSQNCYYLCSVADCIMLNPQGSVEWCGLAAQPVFYKGLLEKIGVKMQVFKVGAYKSAVEPFTQTEMSEENRRQVSSYLHDIWGRILDDVSDSRHLTAETLDAYADSMLTLASGEELLEKGLVDTLSYLDGVQAYIQRGHPDSRQLVSVEDWNLLQKPVSHKEKIAVYYAYGDIVERSDDLLADEVIDAGKMCADLKMLRNDQTVKAVVLRVNSGGGSAYASEQIWREVKLLSREKPVVVSMGGMAASGAYYFASAANYVYALPMTLTGSIGIFGVVPDGSCLLDEKLGLSFDVVKTNRRADFGTVARPFDPDEAAMMQSYIRRGYHLFLKRVAEGRGLSEASVEELAQGRVWTGAQALRNGLVDEAGTLQDAIGKARQLGGVSTCGIVTYPQPAPWYMELFDEPAKHYFDVSLQRTVPGLGRILRDVSVIAQTGQLQARIPYSINLINWN